MKHLQKLEHFGGKAHKNKSQKVRTLGKPYEIKLRIVNM
jgi:hypothetical protein